MLLSTTSFGWLARLKADFARSTGLRAYGVDVSAAFGAARINEKEVGIVAPPRDVIEGAATLLVFLNPHQLAFASAFLPDEIFERKYLIAYCAWELERIPISWLEAIDVFEEIWVPSEFVRSAMRESGVSIPCRVMPPALVRPRSIKPDRSRFGIPPKAFVILVALSLRSGLARKNPLAAARAFLRAFPNDQEVRLVFKVSDVDIESTEWTTLRNAIGEDPRFIILTDFIADADMWVLIASIDVVLSTHRAEGFGMVLAQAMLCSRAVVATGWSGNLDFMDSDCVVLLPYTLVPVIDPGGVYVIEGAHWAEVDEVATADALRRLYIDPLFRETLAHRGHESAHAYFARHSKNLFEYLQTWIASPHESDFDRKDE